MPILSICIPTYNRAELLESALTSLAPQVEESSDEVELIVSDNCSTDDTARVLERMKREYTIRYHKHNQNVGVVRNVLGVVANLAAGDFCWVMGDDEIVREGAVKRLLQAIKEHSDLDYFYVNYSIDSFERREGVFVTADDFKEWTRTGNPNLEERRIARWETLIAEDFNGLTPIYCSVFRRSMWLKGATRLRMSDSYMEDALYSTVDETYPQSLILSRMMLGRPVWSSGYPWLIMCGKESWSEYIPAVVLLRFHELLDAYLEAGVDGRLIDGHRRRMLSYSAGPLTRFFLGEDSPGLESFSVPTFVTRHYRYPELWRSVCDALIVSSPSQIVRRSLMVAIFALPAKILFRCLRLLKRVWARVDPPTTTSGEGREHG